jgi:outer membrane murein-binding lipoprotein Lpp
MMTRFLMLVGVAVVAAAMYVAAGSASQRSSAPSAKQFKALQKQVTTLNKNLKALKKDETQVKGAAVAAVEFLGLCYLDSSGNTVTVLPVAQKGGTTTGYLFGTPGSGTPTATTALDKVTTGAQENLQEVNSQCLTASALKHRLARLSARLGH